MSVHNVIGGLLFWVDLLCIYCIQMARMNDMFSNELLCKYQYRSIKIWNYMAAFIYTYIKPKQLILYMNERMKQKQNNFL